MLFLIAVIKFGPAENGEINRNHQICQSTVEQAQSIDLLYSCQHSYCMESLHYRHHIEETSGGKRV